MKTFFKVIFPVILLLIITGYGNETIAQNNLSTSISDPLNTEIPYLKYQGIEDKEMAMRQWVKDNPQACTVYIKQLTKALEGVDRDSLNPREAYFVKRREYECKKLTKLTHNNQ